MKDGCPTEEELIAAWRWWKSLPPKERPPLGRREFDHRRRRYVWTGNTRGYDVQLGQLIEAYGSVPAALAAVEQRRRIERETDAREWWDTVSVILYRMSQKAV